MTHIEAFLVAIEEETKRATTLEEIDLIKRLLARVKQLTTEYQK